MVGGLSVCTGGFSMYTREGDHKVRGGVVLMCIREVFLGVNSVAPVYIRGGGSGFGAPEPSMYTTVDLMYTRGGEVGFGAPESLALTRASLSGRAGGNRVKSDFGTLMYMSTCPGMHRGRFVMFVAASTIMISANPVLVMIASSCVIDDDFRMGIPCVVMYM